MSDQPTTTGVQELTLLKRFHSWIRGWINILTAYKKTTPRHGVMWDMETLLTGYRWSCHECSATGISPTQQPAEAAAHIHWLANHTLVRAHTG